MGSPKPGIALSTPPATACLASPLLFGKMAPQGQSVPCLSQENTSFRCYLMELWPEHHKRVSPCLSFPSPEGLAFPLSGQLAKLCKTDNLCPCGSRLLPVASCEIWASGAAQARSPRLALGHTPPPLPLAGLPPPMSHSGNQEGNHRKKTATLIAPGGCPSPGPSKAGALLGIH